MAFIETGKPIEKLIDTVSSAIGTIYKPRSIRNEADAEAYKIKKIAEAKAHEILIMDDVNTEIIDRAKTRLYQQEIKRQNNVENIIEGSIPYLSETVSEIPVDEDWRTRFFNNAKDISNETTQQIWSKILASKISNPNSISLRTIDILKNLDPSEAILFEKAASLCFDDYTMLKVSDEKDFAGYDLDYSDMMKLKEAGLIFENNTHSYGLKFHHEISFFTLRFHKKIALIKDKKGKSIMRFQSVPLTNAGVDLMKAINFEPNYKYFEIFTNSIKAHGHEVNIQDMKIS